MADEVMEPAPIETPAEPTEQVETATEESTGQEKEESPASEEKSESQDETVSASDAAEKERSEREQRASETAKRQAIELRELKRQHRALQQQVQQFTAQQHPRIAQPPAKPKLEDYDDVSKFESDIEKWKDEDRKYAIQQYETQRQERERQAAYQKQLTEFKANVDKQVQKFVKANPGFDLQESLDAIGPSQTMDEFFADSDIIPQMVQYLDQNPDEADRIKQLPPGRQRRELTRLEDKLTAQIKGIKAKPVPVKPPGQAAGRASSPAAPKTAADVLYG